MRRVREQHSAEENQNDPRSAYGRKMIKDQRRARMVATLWIVYTFVVNVCALVVHFAPTDLLCEEKGTCECGNDFKYSFLMYIAILDLCTIFKFVVKCKTRRQLKKRQRLETPIICGICLLSYSFPLFDWVVDSNRDNCMEDTNYARLKLFETIIIACAGIQLCLQILSSIICLYRNCIRYKTIRKMKAQGLVYQSSD